MTTPDNPRGEITRYEHSGIEERHGSVPAWLVSVIVALALWMVYYLVHFWKPK